jgi:hypothetical protein
LTAVISASVVRPAGEPPARRLCEAARAVLGVDGVSMSMLPRATGLRVVLASTGQVSDDLEAVEDVLGLGPAHVAAAGSDVLLEPGAGAAPWTSLVAEFLHRSRPPWVAAVPLRDDSNVLGVLLLHAEHPAAALWSPRWLREIAGAVGLLLAMQPPTWLEATLDGRHAANRAIGMLMTTQRTDASTALAILRARAFANGARLDTTAWDVIRNGGRDDHG